MDATAALAVGRAGTSAAADDHAGRVRAARELQTVFLTQLLAAMRATVPDGGATERSPERSVYEGAFDRAVAEALSAGDVLGLERQIAGPEPADGVRRTASPTVGAAASVMAGTGLKLSPSRADRDGEPTLPDGSEAGGPQQ